MHLTLTLNPYERELYYGFPYVVGRVAGSKEARAKTVRGPVLYLPVEIEPSGDSFRVSRGEDNAYLNPLIFQGQSDSQSSAPTIQRLIDAKPSIPVSSRAMKGFLDEVLREFPDISLDAQLDGSLGAVPTRPKQGSEMRVIDQAALFVAPKGSYFLVSDLDTIASDLADGGQAEQLPAMAALLAGAGQTEQVDLSTTDIDSAEIYYPFPSNRSQRRVAMLVDDPNTNVVRVEGPPGTGKSLTIANLVCHLVATGRSVLVTSQKDKAIEVVNDLLEGLGLSELPMTLLRRDRQSKLHLRNRLDSIKKERPRDEVATEAALARRIVAAEQDTFFATRTEFADSAQGEAHVEAAARALKSSRGVGRISSYLKYWFTRRRWDRRAPVSTDRLAALGSAQRDRVRRHSNAALRIGAESRVSSATRGERQSLRELQQVLRRDQTNYKNYSVFDHMKSDVQRASGLLKILPAWLMTPDDVSRLFPCQAGLFDVVIIDEASQVDLPSIFPILYRAKKIVVSGDSRQMQARRFAFAAAKTAVEAYARRQMGSHDPAGFLDARKESLLDLAFLRSEEENLLDEHYRSLPPIIEFSNHRWYENQLRIMTDEENKKFGRPDGLVINIHHVVDGQVTDGTQQNEREAVALVDELAELVSDPDYAGATFGVIALFEEQMRLLQDLVAAKIDEEAIGDSEIVVVNPDGFQGDERDVVLYSLSYDANVMPQSAISARMMDSPHIQGMLNVAFTRARDEIHVFHSADKDKFSFSDGRPSALSDWLDHCYRNQDRIPSRPSSRLGRSDSEFEAEVASALTERGVAVMQQYPACGFFIDMECRLGSRRLGLECDGEAYHLDEHGDLKMEDLERQSILERAGWIIERIPYRRWRDDPDVEIARIIDRLEDPPDGGGTGIDDGEGQTDLDGPVFNRKKVRSETATDRVDMYDKEFAVFQAVKNGSQPEQDVLSAARAVLQNLHGKGFARLGSRIKRELLSAASKLQKDGLIILEEGEYFLTGIGRRTAPAMIVRERPVRTSSQTVRRSRKKRTGSSTGRTCSACGRKMTVRNSRYGRFLGCSGYPRCRNTQSLR